jgi:hypothetical protein
MKTVFSTFTIAVMILMTASCKKTNTCDYGDGNITEYENLSKAQINLAKSLCEAAGGEWR